MSTTATARQAVKIILACCCSAQVAAINNSDFVSVITMTKWPAAHLQLTDDYVTRFSVSGFITGHLEFELRSSAILRIKGLIELVRNFVIGITVLVGGVLFWHYHIGFSSGLILRLCVGVIRIELTPYFSFGIFARAFPGAPYTHIHINTHIRTYVHTYIQKDTSAT